MLSLKSSFLALLLLAAAPASPAEVRFASEIPDLPLMQGLEELPEAGVVFDKPSGRIVEAYAQGAVTPEAVLAFYRETLPQLGWRLDGPASFLREGERLSIEVGQESSTTTVRFTLSPE